MAIARISRSGCHWCWVMALACMTLAPQSTLADWVNLTGAETAPNIAEITVTDEAVTVAFEVYPADLEFFETDQGFGLVIEADGVALTPEVQERHLRERKDRVSPYAGMIDPRTRRQIPGPPEDKQVVFFQLHYALHESVEQLTFIPPVDEKGSARATIGFLLYHKAAPVVDFRYLSRAETLILNREDPWFTAFENKNLIRHHRWPQMTFLYVEPREVRHESLVRVRDVMAWSSGSADMTRRLTATEQAAVKTDAADFFRERNPVTIDGATVHRSAHRVEFLSITPTGLQALEPGATVDASAALLGISESYWIDHLPQSVLLEWQIFDDQVDQIPTNIIDPAGPFPGFIDTRDPILEWQNHLQDWVEPAHRPVPAGDGSWFDLDRWRRALFGLPAEETTALVLQELLRRCAIAFLERDPEQRAQALALLVEDPDLTRPALAQVFAIPTTGGGSGGITALGDVILESQTATAVGISVLANWRAQIQGQHWGHVDQRMIDYRAVVDVGVVDGVWKLLDLTVLEAKPISG